MLCKQTNNKRLSNTAVQITTKQDKTLKIKYL